MKHRPGVKLSDVQAVYSGPEGDLWELVMGEQIHVGGLASSMALAAKAGIGEGMSGIDLCCCNGAGMRFLLRFQHVAAMQGVDATAAMVQRCRQRCQAAGVHDRVRVVQADVCVTGLPAGEADFIWGEDAWCYVADKEALVAEAVRLTRPGGTIAFTDWMEGHGLSDADAQRFMAFMTFPSLLSLGDYADLLHRHGCDVLCAEDTRCFAPCVQLYIEMLTRQLTYDALRCTGFDTERLQVLGDGMRQTAALAAAGRLLQGRVVARKRP